MAEFENANQENVSHETNDETVKVEAPFREFKTQKEFDDFSAYLLRKGEEKALKNAKVDNGETVLDYKDYEKKYRKDLEAQIRADIERQAKMTESEKLAEREKEMARQYDEREIELNRREAKILLSDAGYDEEDMEIYLDFVTTDREASLGKIRRVCESKRASLEKQKQAILDELQKNSPNMKFGSASDANALQARYDQAAKSNNAPLMSSIIREAAEKGISLKY